METRHEPTVVAVIRMGAEVIRLLKGVGWGRFKNRQYYHVVMLYIIYVYECDCVDVRL